MTDPASLQERLAGLTKEQRALLFEQIRKRKERAETPPERRIPRRPPDLDPVPVSFAQERLWFMDRLAPGNAAYSIPMALRLDGEVAPAVLEAVLGEVVRRHEAVRTTFREADGQPVQVIAPPGRWSLPLADLSGLPADRREAEARSLALEDAARPFDLEAGPLLRAILLRLEPAVAVLLVNMHHIVSDGWSMGVLVREITALYGAAVSGGPSPLPELPVQYADFAVWQRRFLQGEALERQIAYWRERLTGVPVSLDLPADRPRPAAPTYRGRRLSIPFDRDLTRTLNQLARGHDSSLYMVLLAGFQALLGRLAGQEDFALGSPIANRHRAEIEPLIGFFVNFLVMRSELRGDPSIQELLARTRRATLEAFSHQDLPFERLVEELRPERHLSLTPLFQVVLAVQNSPLGRLDLPAFSLSPLELEDATVQFDLELHVWERGGELLAVLAYSVELFEAPTVLRLMGHLRTLLGAAAADPACPLSSLPLLSEPERHQLLHEWNGPVAGLEDGGVVARIAARAVRAPEAVAVAAAARGLTYGELWDRAARLAGELRALGVGPGIPVGLYAERSPELVTGALAVLLAGGAYLPLDPTCPEDRLALMARESRMPVLLVPDGKAPVWAGEEVRALALDGSAGAVPMTAGPADPEQLAYVIYTSGSTGRPKGVQIPHRGLGNLVSWHLRTYGVTARDRVTLIASPAFDASVWEIWPALVAGASLHIPTDEVRLAPGRLLDWLAAEAVTLSFLPTPLAEQVLETAESHGLPVGLRLRFLLTGGDRLQRRPRMPLSFILVNHYGPTESSVVATAGAVEPDSSSRPPSIGRPVDGVRAYVLGPEDRLVPAGSPGELLLGGAGLARGYLGRPELTAEKFVPDLFATSTGQRLYRTGDLVRFLPDGGLDFLGRVDTQVKLRGFRIELGEVESALLRHPLVKEAVVELKDGAGAGRQLVAYVAARPEAAAGAGDSSEHVAQWRTLYDETYARSEAVDTTFDIEGWNSSYTGEPIPAEEMREWVEGAVARLLTLPHARVLEVGCGTGLLTFRVAPHAERYVGTDFSPVALDLVRREAARRGLSQVSLERRTADDWTGVEPGSFDLVVINSVAQYFPGVDYLVRVLEGAARAVRSGGAIFVGDVRSLLLLEALHLAVELFRAPGSMPVAELRRRVRRRVADEEELLLDPAFFHALARRLSASAEILPKAGRHLNELTRFRYDAVLSVGPPGTAGVLAGHLPAPDLLAARLSPELAALDLLAGAGRDLETVEDLRRAVAERASRGFDPGRLGYGEPPAAPADLPWSAFANDPLRGKRARVLVPELRRALQAELPDYMVPAAFVVLDSLPLTAHGKVDRAALPEPEPARSGPGSTPPRTPAERDLAAIWRELLGVEEVGIEDNFFELGGHSLLATQLVSRVRAAFGVELPLRGLFEDSTLGGLAAMVAAAARVEGRTDAPRRPARRATAPASFAQERLWFLDRLEPGGAAYNIPLALRLRGELSPALLAAVLGEVIRRHEALRTTFQERAGRPVQVVAPPGEWVLPVVDLAELPAVAGEVETLRLAAREAVQPFDLERGPLLRATLLRLGEAGYVLNLAMHHIVSDGWSMGVLVREVTALYGAALAGKPSPLPELPLQYPDFALWQREWLAAGELERQLAYWRGKLASVPDSLDLPADRPRPAVPSHQAGQHRFAFGQELARNLHRLARQERGTLFMVLLAGFQALLRRLTGQEDVPVGSPIANRNRTEIEPLIGFFVNTLVLRGDLAGDPTFRELLARVRRTTLEAYAHQDLPFERLVGELNPERSLSRTPLFQVMFALQNAPVGAVDLPGLSLEPLALGPGIAQFELTLEIRAYGDDLVGDLEYDADLFFPATAARLAEAFRTLTAGVAADPDRRLSEAPLLSAAERVQVLREWNDTPWDSDGEPLLHRLIAAQAAATPDALAVLCAAGGSLTYGELAARAGRLARRLRRVGVGLETRVAVAAGRSPELVVGMLAILAAGGAYVPLDPELPAERLAWMLEDSGAVLLLADEPLATRVPVLSPADDGDPPGPGLWADADPAAAAYVIYTSGSTGLPKGVVVSHRSAAIHVRNMVALCGLGPGDRELQFGALGFDATIDEIWCPLACGAAVVFRSEEMAGSVHHLLREMARLGVTVPSLPTAFWHEIAAALEKSGERLPEAVRLFTIGGEAVQPGHLAAWLRGGHAPVLNLYGPTEITVAATSALLPDWREGELVPIGRPFGGAQAFIMDPEFLQPAPAGIWGELLIGGPGVARGYLERPDLTAERFVPDGWSGEPGARVYRTGDRARFLPDGVLAFGGRIDRQVKVRGFRVEPGEIEAALTAHPGLKDAAVVARRNPGRETSLLAFAVPADAAAAPTAAELRTFLAGRLSGPMIPAAFVVLPALPLNANDKVDHEALARLAPERETAPGSGTPPGSPAEVAMAGLWREVLDLENVSLEDNFFELGGHSLLATRLTSRIREVFGAELPLRTLFERPTLEGLAAAVEEQAASEIPASLQERLARLSPQKRALLLERLRKDRPGAEAAPNRIPRRAPDSGPVPASLAQERIWFMDRLAPGNSVFNLPSPLRLRGRLDPEILERAFQEIFRRHDSLRTRFEERDGAPVQVAVPPGPWSLPRADLAALPPDFGRREAERLAVAEAAWPFDLARGPLLRAVLVRLAAEEHALLMTCHHIVTDGWSMGVLVRELTEHYRAFATGRPSPLPEPSIQYADFAAWQRERLAGGGLEEQIGYWREQLAGAPAHLDLPLDRPRPAVQTYRGDSVTLGLPRELAAGLQALSVAESASLFMTLLAGLKVVLHRWSGQDDVVVGTPVAGRERPETEGVIGYFLNLLALRTGFSGRPAFRELLRRERTAALDAYSHQAVPFERLLAELDVERDLSRAPVFQVLFNMLNLPDDGAVLPGGVEVEPFVAPEVEAKYDFTLYAQEGADGVSFHLVYNPDLFDRERMAELLRQLQAVLEQVARDADRSVESLSLVTPEAAAWLPALSRPLAPEWPGSVHERFLVQARRTPDRPAAAGLHGVWTYGDLDAASGRLAAGLLAAGVAAGEPVAVWAHRAVPLAAALLGVLRAGAAFAILDPAYPPDRLAAVVERARPRAWVAVPGSPAPPPFLAGLPRLEVEGPGTPVDPGAPCAAVHPDAPAWIAFTSGSTGEPKGIVGSHRPLSHFLDWHARTFGLGEEDRFSLLSGLAHDPLLRDVFTPLWVGGELHVPDPERMAEPGWLAGWFAREGATVAHLTPAMGRLLAGTGEEAPLPALRLVCSGGEALTGEDVARLRRIAPGALLVNFYGATETPQAMGWKVVAGTPARIPLGRGIEGVDLLVLGPGGEPAGVGELGEVCIRTPYLALGYLNDPAGTAERFAPAPGGRLYRTGDLGRYEPGGEVTFAGRADRQLKLRGFRVEPGEIEAAIGRLDGVRESLVMLREDGGEPYLAAYVVAAPGTEPGLAGRLRPFLACRLPGYAVPAAFIELPVLPLTPNGKVDRRALPAPLLETETGTGPRTPAEETLAGIWAALLRRRSIGVHESFFDLGGHSLLATQMIARVRASLGVELPLRALFDTPTIAGLAERIEAAWRARETGLPAPPSLRPVSRERPLPLSFAQERLWFLAQLAPGGAAYDMPAAVRLLGDLDCAALAATLSEIRRRHETLRTTFQVNGEEPVQVVHPPAPLPLPLADLSALPEEVRAAESRRLAEEQARTPYDLARGPLVRARLLRLAADEHALLWNTHHIVSDAWSVGVLVREVAALYEAFLRNRPSPLPELPLQYGDYAAWQRDWLRGPVLEEQIGYWRRRLAGASPLDLPTDRLRPPVPSTGGASRSWTLPAGTTEALRRLALAEGATLFMALHAGFAALLHLYTGRTDVVTGSPVANRSRAELEGLIGFFINTVVLRANLAGDPGFRELIARSREAALGAWAHQDLPFEKLVDELGLPRDPFRQPLLRILLQLRNVPVGEDGLELPGLTLAPFDLEVETAKFDLVANFAEGPDTLYGELRYDTDLFDPATIERLAGHLGSLLSAWAADPDRRLAELPVLSRAESHQLLVEWNQGSPLPVRRSRCLHRIFEEQVDRAPDAVAVVAGAERLTYRELDERANRLARRLRTQGAGPGTRVALQLERSVDLVAAILAVLKTGAAYVPLDPAYPAERLAFTLQDSGASLLVTEGDAPGESADRLAVPADPGLPAYVIYTSGSTGRPKGVVVTHANVDRLFAATDPWFDFGPHDVWTLFHSYAFDFSVWELWGALLQGGRLVVVPYWVSRSPEAFYDLLIAERVTVLNQTPSAFRQLIWAGEAADLALRYVIFGGEALEPASLAPWFERHGDERPRLINMYGITETTVHVTYRQVRREDTASAVGVPIPDLSLHLLDSALRPQPIGVPGEIHVGGAGLAQGYLNRPELTAERFIPNPFGEPGSRLYRSGDLARRLPDGDLEYLGRIDHQVKIRGFRIELGEIETVLAAQSTVREAVVLAREDRRGGERRLVAYVVPALGETPEAAVLRGALAERLPDHMLPSAFVVLAALPLTANGKVDRRALPEPGETAAPHSHVPSRTDLERFLAGQFRDVLGLDREVGVHDDFFALGGTSITGAIFIHRLQEALGEIVHVVTIFDHPTVAALADYVRERHAGIDAAAAPAGPEEIAEMRRLIKLDRPAVPEPDEPLNPPAVFVLAPPRSGTTLLRVMLGSHPALFAPPELELLSFRAMDERRAAFEGRDAFWLEGLIRAVMEARGVDAAEAERIVGEWERQGWTTRRATRQLQEWLGDRVLVDKTPSYALDPEVLHRAEEGFAGARYLHLVRHPQATNRSFEEAKLDQIFFRRPHSFSRRQLAELIWTVSHRNILDFLAGVPRERWMTVRFEELVREPDRVLADVCAFLGLEYRPEMADPYRPDTARMVDGPHAVSRMLGDVKFLGHGRVDPAAAERWRSAREVPLGAPARELARELGYADSPARSVLVPLQPGAPDRRPLFLVHPVGGEVIAYHDLARRLGPNQPVWGLQSPDPPLDDLREMAARYLDAVREIQPQGPYRLAGWSVGGVVAYEMARQLEERGEKADLLTLIDVASPARWSGEPELSEGEMVALFASDLARLHGLDVPDLDLSGLGADTALARVLDLGREAGLLPPGITREELRRLFDRFRANRHALSTYEASLYAGDVLLVRAAERVARLEEGDDPTLGWSALISEGLRIHDLPGDHYTVLREEPDALASLLLGEGVRLW